MFIIHVVCSCRSITDACRKNLAQTPFSLWYQLLNNIHCTFPDNQEAFVPMINFEFEEISTLNKG